REACKRLTVTGRHIADWRIRAVTRHPEQRRAVNRVVEAIDADCAPAVILAEIRYPLEPGRRLIGKRRLLSIRLRLDVQVKTPLCGNLLRRGFETPAEQRDGLKHLVLAC